MHLFRTVAGRFSIYDDMTGERYQLREGHQWHMSFKDGWAFVHAQGCAPTWCTRLLRKSIWQNSSGRLFLRMAEDAGGECQPRINTIWLDEANAVRKSYYLQWRHADLQNDVASIKVIGLQVPRAGSMYFWCLPDVQANANFQVAFSSGSRWIGKSAGRWCTFLDVLQAWCRPFDEASLFRCQGHADG